MTNPLRQALDQVELDDSFLSRLSRASLRAGEQKFFTPRTAVLEVEIDGPRVDAYVGAQVSMAVMDSVAHFSKALGGAPDRVRVTQPYREALGFTNLGSIGNKILLGFPAAQPDKEAPLIDRRETPSKTETSTRALTLVLPENQEDDEALDAALGLKTPERLGLQKLSERIDQLSRSIELTLKISDGQRLEGQLSSEQARVLKNSLAESSTDEWEIDVTGVLDGMRTRRRQFFLETENGRNIAGTIDEELLESLPQFINRKVEAKIACRRQRQASGRLGRTGHRLIAIKPAPGTLNL